MSPTTARLSALVLSVALVATGAPAYASEEESPAPVATLSLSSPAVLTLPAGDGVRDVTSVTLTSDIATEVTIDVLAADGLTVLRSGAPVSLPEGSLSAPVDVQVAGLPAGKLQLRATPPLPGTPVTVPLTVGSGQPKTATLALSTRTIFTWAKSKTKTSVATVSAVDETGLAIPFAGSVTAKVGSKTQKMTVTSKTGAAAKATITAARLVKGTASVVASVAGNGKTATSNTVSLAVKNVAVSAAKLSASTTTVYPTKDGFKDSVKLTLKNTTTTGAAIAATGTVKITSKGKTIKSWKLTSSKTWSKSWDGKVKGKLVPGTYTVTASVKGPEGATKKTVSKITVKKGKLVTKTTKKTVKANTVLKKYIDFGDWDYNMCWENYDRLGDVFCDGDDSIDGTLSVVSTGTVSVPSAVVSAQKYGGAKVRMSAKISTLYNQAHWAYLRAGEDTGKSTQITRVGTSTLGWLSLPATSRKLEVLLGLGEYSFAGVDTFTIEYSYKVLSTK